jgi:hypothetical protein
MERSEGVSVVLDHIMKMMDRSSERLLRSFNRVDSSEIGHKSWESSNASVPATAVRVKSMDGPRGGRSPGRILG